ncbi:unnamed protein product, partial [Prorocentrum cordatum]
GGVAMRPPYFVGGADDGDDAISPQQFMGIVEGTQKLNMRELIRRGTSMGALATRPEVLAVYVDPRWRRGDTLFYMSGIGSLPDWGDVPEVALQVGGEDVVYRLRSYVQCKLPEERSIAPDGLLTGPEGHYVAHFVEGDEWCTADDLGDRPRVAQRPPGTRHVVDSAGGAGDDGDVSADGGGSPSLDGGRGEEGGAGDASLSGARKRPAASARSGAPPKKRLRLRGKQSAAGRRVGRSRAGRQQCRAGRQQLQCRYGRQGGRSRAGRQQEDKQSDCKPEEVLRQGRKPKSKGDNDGSRQIAQNNAAAPVVRSSKEAKSLQTACDARRECGDLFLLLHLLEPLASADDLLLRGALGVTAGEISDAKRRLENGEWHMHHVAELLDERLNSAHSAHSVAAAVHSAVGDGPGAQGDGNPLRCPAPALHYARRMCEAEFPNREAFKARQGRVRGGQRWYQSQYVARCELESYQPSPTEERQVVARFRMSHGCATVDPVDEPFAPKPEPEACVCCAMQQWSENLHSECLVGDKCTIKDRAQFADCLSAEWHHQRWPLIPRDELMSSAVDFPHNDCEGPPTSTNILLHKRRVPLEALEGKVPVKVRDDCRRDLWSDHPKVPVMAPVNDLWLGRHRPLLRKAALAHQMLLALGRVVSTKIYQSSKGADEAVRQEQQSWRQKCLQYATQGTAIVFGSGNVDHATRSFPPAEYDAQAPLLKQHNYACNGPGVQYRSDLVDRAPPRPGVPDFMLACAKYVPTGAVLDDVAQAQGPASATTGAQAEMSAAAEDAQELTKWLSVLEDHMDDVSELTSLPALQGMLERMESQAGRVVANELMSRLEEKGGEDRALPLDEIGRHRLRDLCREFHARCRKIFPVEDMAKLRWRVQALETRNCQAEEGAGDLARPAGVAGTPAEDDPRSLQGPPGPDGQRKARLRVPTSRKAESWWNPKYWSIARPTDFCHGDCAWGLGQLPRDGDEGPQKQKEGRLCFSAAHFIQNLLTWEEMEYDVPADEEKFVASHGDDQQHFMKTPGAFGAARACAGIAPEMIEEVQLRAQQTGGKATLHGILKDKDTPNEVRKAIATLGQATASQVGSDGHRRELRGEGEAYTLRFGPPIQFATPNLADTKQPLILIVQGEEYTFGNDLTEAAVFELMMRLFFAHILGLRPEPVGWRRGEVRKASEHWISDGVAADLMGVPTVFGPLAAAFGPVEAQGRGSLRPHILIWLLQGQLRVLLDMLQRDEARFPGRLNLWMRQVVQAVVAAQQSAVGLLPLQLQGGENECGVVVPPLPFGPNEKRYFRADGGAEMATAEQLGVEGETEPQGLWLHDPKVDDYHRAIRPGLPLRNNDGEAVDGDAAWTEQRAAENKGYWRRPLSSSASGIFPRYRGGGTLAESPPSDEWIREMCRDAREHVIGCGIHVCSPSCYKYHSDKTRGSQICRHNFYNPVTLCTWPEECRLRTRGKALRGCIGIFRETDNGMAGRVVTFQHPGETSTKYAAVVSARCNVDVQDMRRALPPRLRMEASELEPLANEEDRKSYNHGLYPQRYADFSVGAREDWGELANSGSPAVDCDDAARADLQRDLERHALATFVDAHNTSYYVNSYTTNVNPSMDDVLCKLLDGARRLKSQWDDRGAQAAGGAGDEAQSTAAGKRREDFKRTLQVLARFETCFRRASWKSGSEMIFPMLFGHLSFMTHRCWKADAAESAPAASITHAVPGTGQQVAMPGLREVQREGAMVYVSPDGVEFDTIEYAHQAFQIANASGGSLREVTKALNRMREGEAEEVPEAPGPTVEGLAQGKFRGAVLSQHDD